MSETREFQVESWFEDHPLISHRIALGLSPVDATKETILDYFKNTPVLEELTSSIKEIRHLKDPSFHIGSIIGSQLLIHTGSYPSADDRAEGPRRFKDLDLFLLVLARLCLSRQFPLPDRMLIFLYQYATQFGLGDVVDTTTIYNHATWDHATYRLFLEEVIQALYRAGQFPADKAMWLMNHVQNSAYLSESNVQIVATVYHLTYDATHSDRWHGLSFTLGGWNVRPCDAPSVQPETLPPKSLRKRS